MPDLAATVYVDMLGNVAAGHRSIAAEFGVSARDFVRVFPAGELESPTASRAVLLCKHCP